MKTPTLHYIRLFLLICLALPLQGCATTSIGLPPEEPAMHSVEEFSDDEQMLMVDDPWEGFNRRMYQFNYYAEKYFTIPVVSSYEYVTPVVVQDGVSNFFNNIGELKTIYNAAFQGKGEKTFNALGRLVINSTIGIAGLFDVAKKIGLERQPEDFGQTLGVWGVGTGPYVIVPLVGPNTARSATGFAVDLGAGFAMTSAVDPYRNMDNGAAVEAAVIGLEAVDLRHQIRFRYHESGYPFEYYMVRYLYWQQREFAVMK